MGQAHSFEGDPMQLKPRYEGCFAVGLAGPGPLGVMPGLRSFECTAHARDGRTDPSKLLLCDNRDLLLAGTWVAGSRLSMKGRFCCAEEGGG